jgi:hypothetical protein
MPDWDDAPVTKMALWASSQERGPSALEREWSGQVKQEGDFVLLIAGCYLRGATPRSWTALWWNVSEREGDADAQRARAARAPAASVERFVAPFAREARVRVMQGLYAGARSADGLAQATGMGGGALHSHLDELTQASLVEKSADGTYSLTTLGYNLLLTMTSLAGVTVEDRGAGGLVMGWTG